MTVEAWDTKHSQSDTVILMPDPRVHSFASVFIDAIPQKDRIKFAVLDLGCGNGSNAYWIGKLGCTVIGVDFSTAALTKSVSICDGMENVKFIQSGVDTKLPFGDGSFQLIIDVRSLECLTTDRLSVTLKEASRLLCKDGFFISIMATPERLPEHDVLGSPSIRHTREELEELLQPLNFKEVSIYREMAEDGLFRPIYDWHIRAQKGD